MNIQEAKEQIKNAVHLYLKKNEDGVYEIPVNRQRPIFLLGAPGLGKTAVMEQIAGELDIALVSYSMTHHTRQSALGLPVIEKAEYEGHDYEISRYTMSEIIASIYEVMKKSEKKEGILFLDEINCISETLTPSMLLFLQYKVFGSYHVPDGWVIVTAGNPPEYNRAVREFDIVTLDRMRVINVEPDYEVFRTYAKNRNMHPAVLGYLDCKKDHFYIVNRGVKGVQYVTARGWEDLSKIMQLSEQEGMPVNEELVFQYLHHETIAQEFFSYYQLFCKYQENYQTNRILKGNVDQEIVTRAKEAPFDERIALLSLLLDALSLPMEKAMLHANCLSQLADFFKDSRTSEQPLDFLCACRCRIEEEENARKSANILTKDDRKKYRLLINFLTSWEQMETTDRVEAYQNRLKEFIAKTREETTSIQEELENVFAFVEKAYGDGQEMLLFVTELSTRGQDAAFLATFGSKGYADKSEKLALTNRSNTLAERYKRLELDNEFGI